MLFYHIKSIKVYWSKQKHLRAKTIYIKTVCGVGSSNVRENGAPVGIQAVLETGHCRSFSDVWRQSIPRAGRTYSKSRFPPGKMKTWLTDPEVVPEEVTVMRVARRKCRSIEGSLSSWRHSGYDSLLKLFTHLVASRCINSINWMSFWR